jgi:hypothetical protein
MMRASERDLAELLADLSVEAAKDVTVVETPGWSAPESRFRASSRSRNIGVTPAEAALLESHGARHRVAGSPIT